MYYYCPHCQTWRADSYVRIDPRTRIPQCTYCDEFVNGRLSDGEYRRLRGEHPLGVPAPTALREADT